MGIARHFGLCQLATIASLALVSPAFAGTAVTIASDHAKILSVAGTPTSIIVGNPMYADVSLQGGKVVLFGRSSGQTNIILLDGDGNQLANFDVTVSKSADANNLTIYKAGERISAVCSPICEQTLQSGDSSDAVKELTETIKTKLEQTQQAAGIGGGTP
ncbi:MAG: pilus assembly protein N-terminal domain-containing protein [Hyphomicrobiales bacterium]